MKKFNDYPDPREDRLPKWAQELIRELRVARERAVQDLEDHRASQTPTNIWYGDYDNRVYVPANSAGTPNVHFQTHGPNDPEPFLHDIQVRHCRSPYYPNMIDVSGGDGIVITPYGSNGVRIRTER